MKFAIVICVVTLSSLAYSQPNIVTVRQSNRQLPPVAAVIKRPSPPVNRPTQPQDESIQTIQILRPTEIAEEPTHTVQVMRPQTIGLMPQKPEITAPGTVSNQSKKPVVPMPQKPEITGTETETVSHQAKKPVGPMPQKPEITAPETVSNQAQKSENSHPNVDVIRPELIDTFEFVKPKPLFIEIIPEKLNYYEVEYFNGKIIPTPHYPAKH